MAAHPIRSLHWVFKVGDRTATADFYQNLLGMEVLRHEEFKEGCAAACNGPYDGMWSKTMMGYGEEDTNFALELTYNYGVKRYELGNDFHSITIHSKWVFQNVQAKGKGNLLPSGKALEVRAPDGYKFVVHDQDPTSSWPVTEIALNVSDLPKSLEYWAKFLTFKTESQSATEAVLSCGPGQTRLRLVQLPEGQAIHHADAFGRIAFSCPGEQLQQLEAAVTSAGYKVHTPYTSLDTPGKATVHVVILQDPDGHEICFVGDEGFRDLSKRDPNGPQLLAEGIEADSSKEWFARKAKSAARMAASEA